MSENEHEPVEQAPEHAPQHPEQAAPRITDALAGYKTYICMALAFAWAVLCGTGVIQRELISAEQQLMFLGAILALGGISLRSAVGSSQ